MCALRTQQSEYPYVQDRDMGRPTSCRRSASGPPAVLLRDENRDRTREWEQGKHGPDFSGPWLTSLQQEGN